jgi:hypothetical protein
MSSINVVVVEIRGAVEMYLPGCLVMSNRIVGVVGTAGANSEKHIIEHLTGVGVLSLSLDNNFSAETSLTSHGAGLVLGTDSLAMTDCRERHRANDMAHTFCRAGEEYAGAGLLLVDRFLVEDGIGGEVEPRQIGARNVDGAAQTFC